MEIKKACRTADLFYFLFCFSLHKLCKHRCTDNGQQTGNCNSKAAHSAFDFPQFHCLRCADGMGGSSKCETFGDRLFDVCQFDHGFCDHISQNSGDDDNCNCDRYDTTKFFRDTHSDSCRDGLRKKCDILLMTQPEQLWQDINTLTILASTPETIPITTALRFFFRSSIC